MARVMSRRSHGVMRMFRNPSITIWPASVPVRVEFCPDASKRDGEKNAGETHAQKRTEQFVGVLNFRHVLMPGPMKHRRRQNQDRGIDEKREHQRAGRVDGREFDRLAFAFRRLLEFPRLHDRRMQIEIMRHDRGADDADADVKHLLVHDDVRTRNKTEQQRR